ncbi:MAG: DinB family protein [Bacteroidia bacterium]
MSQRNETDVLCEVIDNTRELTLYYLTKLKGVDLYKTFTAGQQTFNSAFWIMGHLVWAQDFLILKATSGPDLNIDWLKRFSIGSSLPPREECPPIASLLESMKEVHSKSVNHLKTLRGEELSEINAINLKFGNDQSKRVCIHHCIRHEGVHMGHLSWLAKMHGVK